MAEAATVQLRAGRLHIPAATAERELAGCTAVALMVRDGHWWLLPLRGGAGGLQLKLRNLRGDRVVESQEFFRSQGLEDDAAPSTLALVFDPERGACRLDRVGA